MTVQLFLFLLLFFSVITSLFTEAVKEFLKLSKKTYPSNIIVLIVSVLVAGIGTSAVYIYQGNSWTPLDIFTIFLMICANWLCAMLGYDKVMQAITQITGGK